VKYDLKDRTVDCLKTDNGLEFVNERMETLLREKGIVHLTSAPYTPEQNGVIERDNRTVQEAARSTLAMSNLDTKYWAEAVSTAVYLLNRTTNRRLKGVTPFELWKGFKPDLRHIRIFGTEAWKKVDSIARKKFDDKSERRILVGYENNKSYRLLDPQSGKIEVSCSVIFNEKEVRSRNYVFWDEARKQTQEELSRNEEASLDSNRGRN
jgi:transposase InsO family protein